MPQELLRLGPLRVQGLPGPLGEREAEQVGLVRPRDSLETSIDPSRRRRHPTSFFVKPASLARAVVRTHRDLVCRLIRAYLVNLVE